MIQTNIVLDSNKRYHVVYINMTWPPYSKIQGCQKIKDET